MTFEKRFKLVLFWLTFPLFCALALITILLEGLSALITYACHWWEGWCLSYKDNWTYLGDGIWKGKD